MYFMNSKVEQQSQQNMDRVEMRLTHTNRLTKSLSVCNLRNRAIVLIYCTTGIRLASATANEVKTYPKVGRYLQVYGL